MKILLLTNKPPWPPHDGGAYATLSMIKGLSYYGIRITVLYINTFKHRSNINEIPVAIQKMADFHFVDINTEIKKSALLKNLIFSRKPYNLQRFESVMFINKLKELLVNEYDIVQCEGISFYPYYDIIRTLSMARIVLRTHNVENKIWSELSSIEKNPLKKIYYKILSRRLYNIERNNIGINDALVTISSYDLDWFKNSGLSIPSISIPAGIDSSLIPVNSQKGGNRIGYLGSLDWAPNLFGLSWFIRNVWPIVSEKVPVPSLHIAGRRGDERLLKEFSGDNIYFYGEVPDSTEFIDDKTIIICPLFAGSGIRIKIIEAMSRGKVVIATPVAVEGINIRNEENILVADTIQKFADYLTTSLTNESFRVKIGNKAIETVRTNYDIFVISNELMKFYSILIK
jgi:glycosyltransferase involved in cell wall biosynthesis